MATDRETALAQSFEVQEVVAERLRQLWVRDHLWSALMGGSTEDDGTTLRVTLAIEIRYGSRFPTDAEQKGAMSDG